VRVIMPFCELASETNFSNAIVPLDRSVETLSVLLFVFLVEVC